AWATASQQDNDSPRQPLDSAPPLPSRYRLREEKYRPTQSQDQRMLVDLTTDDTGFRCSRCTQIFNSSDNCFALSGCGCVPCQADRKERDGGPCPCCKEHVEDVLLLEWKPLGLERMVDVSAFS
ncbi:hypothetical protein MGG_17298, partial [Pyricularia oryzae 70-15]